jgi:hypothetical protein
MKTIKYPIIYRVYPEGKLSKWTMKGQIKDQADAENWIRIQREILKDENEYTIRWEE